MDSSKILSQRVTNMTESATIKMAQRTREIAAQGHNVISLSLGEPDFDTPIHIKEAAKTALDEGFTKYTPVPGLLELREAICKKLYRDNLLQYNPNQIVVSNGAKQSIANVCLALLNPGDEAVVFSPYWVSYHDIIEFVGAKPIIIKAGIEQNFKVTPDQLESAITDKTKFIIYSSPCNPTGSVYSRQELTELARIVLKYDNLMVVSDEIYEYINFAEDHESMAELPGMIDRTVTINGFSKGFSMTGWRLGYMAGPQWLAKACAKIQGQFTSGAAAFNQRAAAIALESDMEPTKQMKLAFQNRLKLIISLLNEIPGIKTNNPDGAFYIFPDISSYFGKTDGNITINNANDFANYILLNAHVGVVSGSAFGNDNCIRISYAASDEMIIEAMQRIKSALSKLF